MVMSQLMQVPLGCGNGNMQDICRICRCEGELDSPLISPCNCSGSMRYVHHSCLQQWIKSSGTQCCELCKFHFIMHRKMKRFREWKSLDMSPVEKREVGCFIICFVFTTMCVVWFLYKLTPEEIQRDVLGWWIKLIFDAIGFIAALTLMCIKGKVCGQLFRNWRAFNSNIYVQNVPEIRSELQQQAVALSASAQLTTNVVTSEETRRLSLDEDEFHAWQSNSNKTNISRNSSSNCVNNNDVKDTSDEISSTEIVSKCTDTSMPASVLMPMDDHNNPLREVMIMANTTTDPVPSMEEQHPPRFLSKQPQQTTS